MLWLFHRTFDNLPLHSKAQVKIILLKVGLVWGLVNYVLSRSHRGDNDIQTNVLCSAFSAMHVQTLFSAFGDSEKGTESVDGLYKIQMWKVRNFDAFNCFYLFIFIITAN